MRQFIFGLAFGLAVTTPAIVGLYSELEFRSQTERLFRAMFDIAAREEKMTLARLTEEGFKCRPQTHNIIICYDGGKK